MTDAEAEANVDVHGQYQGLIELRGHVPGTWQNSNQTVVCSNICCLATTIPTGKILTMLLFLSLI